MSISLIHQYCLSYLLIVCFPAVQWIMGEKNQKSMLLQYVLFSLLVGLVTKKHPEQNNLHGLPISSVSFCHGPPLSFSSLTSFSIISPPPPPPHPSHDNHHHSCCVLVPLHHPITLIHVIVAVLICSTDTHMSQLK